jgi:hypothetical protein
MFFFNKVALLLIKKKDMHCTLPMVVRALKKHLKKTERISYDNKSLSFDFFQDKFILLEISYVVSLRDIANMVT